VFANRILGRVRGFGIVEQVDELISTLRSPKKTAARAWTSQPSNHELLNAMAAIFAAERISLPAVIQDRIAPVKSQRLTNGEPLRGRLETGLRPYYARKYVRLLARRGHEAIALATGGRLRAARRRSPWLYEMWSEETGKGP